MYLGHKETKSIYSLAEDAILRWYPRPTEFKLDSIIEYSGLRNYNHDSLKQYCDEYIYRFNQTETPISLSDKFVISQSKIYTIDMFDKVDTFVVNVDNSKNLRKSKNKAIDDIIQRVEYDFDFYTSGDAMTHIYMIVGHRKMK